MKRCLVAAVVALSHCVLAQVPTGIVLQRPGAMINEPVKVVVNFAAATSWCGLHLDFGDGDVRDIVVEEFPITLTKQYGSAGRFVLRAEGRLVLRGLRSAPGCTGAARTAVLAVAEPRRVEPAGSGPRDVGKRGREDPEDRDDVNLRDDRGDQGNRGKSGKDGTERVDGRAKNERAPRVERVPPENALTAQPPGPLSTPSVAPARPLAGIKKPRDDTLKVF